jgi:thymidylate kinase
VKPPFVARNQLVIALEGADRMGKTTQVRRLVSLLSNRARDGVRVATVKSPVKGFVFYDRIYDWLRDGRARTRPDVFQFFQIANRMEWVASFERDLAVKEAMHLASPSEYYLVLDRWNASTYAYGQAAGLTRDDIDAWLEPLLEPDLTIVLDGKGHGDAMPVGDSYERDSQFQRDVRRYYLEWAEQHPDVARIVSADGTVDSVADQIAEAVMLVMVQKWQL